MVEKIAYDEYALQINHLEKKYGKSVGVKDISFEVKKGEIFGFLGSNGAGKSTTIRCILGLLAYQKGEITLFEDDYDDLVEALDHVGYIPAEAMFYPAMKVKNVIKLAAKLRRKDCQAEAERLIKWLDIPLHKKIEDLSTGNRKKVAIVCALQHQPELIILDEPTSGLDHLMQERFFELIKQACANGASCLLSSHNLSEVKNYCDRVAIIKKGQIVKVDEVSHLLTSLARKVTIWKDGQEQKRDFSGSSQELISYLEQVAPDDFLVEEPSLESLFMDFYKEEKE